MRPTNGVLDRCRSPPAVAVATARQALIGVVLPFAVTASTASYSIAPCVARYVSSPTTISPTGACCCRREAVLTTSPATMASPSAGRAESVTTASPVFTAPRMRQLELGLLGVERRHRVADGQRRAHGPLGIVAVGRRRAEDRHHGVADELLHDAAEGLELVAHRPVVRRQDRAHVFRVELLRARREADEVDEDDADDPALFALRRLLGQRSPARETEACDLGVVLAARTARGHARILAAIRSHSNGFGSSALVGLKPGGPRPRCRS